jgi:predicted CXXCH cytochrome family protein
VEVTAANGTTITPLFVGTFPKATGDTQLCLSCHNGLGSHYDVYAPFHSGSGHRLAPEPSAYGPSPKVCGSCHDSHGEARTADDAPYPALLQRKSSIGTPVFGGDAFCETCHLVRNGNEFPGASVWAQTPHAHDIAAPSGTKIVCTACHEPHGSPIAPSVQLSIAATTSAPPTPVAGNDRRMCAICHSAPDGVWPGTVAYASSRHASSAATAPIAGEWAPESVTTSRSVGDCQTCHDPMGSADASGDLVPALLRQTDPELCYTCHREGGAATDDLQSLAYTRPAGVLSVVGAFGATPQTVGFGSLDVVTRASTATADPGEPRRFAETGMSDVAVADVNGDRTTEVVSAYAQPADSTAAPRVTILGRSALFGLSPSPGDVTLLAPADLLVAGDILDDVSELPEIVTAETGGSVLRTYRWTGSGLAPVAGGTLDLGAPITGMTFGHFEGGSAGQVAVTVGSPSRLVLVDGGSSLTARTPTVLRAGATNPSVWHAAGHDELVVANAEDTSTLASVVGTDGAELIGVGSATDASATAALVSDVLTASPGPEMAIALSAPDGEARLEVYRRSLTGFGAPSTVDLPLHSNPVSLASGDVDGDGVDEFVVGLAGTFSRSGRGAGPGFAIVGGSSDGTTLTAVKIRSTGAAEAAGSARVVVADLGPIGPSRHPVGEGGSHTSTETAILGAHVACSDCHNVHAADTTTDTAPALYGALKGTRGVGASDVNATTVVLTSKQQATREYEVCLKCHSAWSVLGAGASAAWPATAGAPRDIASELSTAAESFHPVEGPSPAGHAIDALAGPRTPGSSIYCTDCHGDSNSGQPAGPHVSAIAPLLAAAWDSSDSTSSAGLCFDCHRYDIYGSGSAEVTDGPRSGFFASGAAEPSLHAAHAARGLSCSACHRSHGSVDLPYLLRDDIGWVTPAPSGGGACANGCHTEGAEHAYTRP